MNSRTILFALFVVGATAAASGEGRDCSRGFSEPGLSFGHDTSGFWVRTSPIPGSLTGIGHRRIEAPGNYLASEAGAVIVYLADDPSTSTTLGTGEWRGPTPLSALRSFAAAGGLTVDAPSPDLWVVGPKRIFDDIAVTVFARGGDRQSQIEVAGHGASEVEKALVRQLPVRFAGGGANGDVELGVTYYALPDEAPNTFLVIGSRNNRSVPLICCRFTVFKVHVNWVGPEAEIECLWQSSEAWGDLVAEIREDFDGDGTRDFVFGYGGEEHEGTVLSGRTGATLFHFIGGDIAVERAAGRARAVAVTGTAVMHFDAEKGVFVVTKAVTSEGRVAGRQDVGRTAGDLLADELGSRGLVAEYHLGPARLNGFFLTHTAPAGLNAAHVLARYESASRRERRRLTEEATPGAASKQ